MPCNCGPHPFGVIARDVRGYGDAELGVILPEPGQPPRKLFIEGLIFGLGIALAAKLVGHVWPGERKP